MNVIDESVDDTAPRRMRRQARRREEILAAALELVAEQGLDALTLQRLARQLDYVPAALYRYFASKDALLAALSRRVVSELGERLAAVDAAFAPGLRMQSPCVYGLSRLLLAARFYAALPEAWPERFRLISLLMGDPQALVSDAEAEQAVPVLSAVLVGVSRRFAAAASSGALEPGDAGERTVIFWSALHGVAATAKLGRFMPQLFDVPRLSNETARRLLLGWGASAESLSAAEAGLAGLDIGALINSTPAPTS